MKAIPKYLGIWLLLLLAQQGGFVHELSHLHGTLNAHAVNASSADRSSDRDATCALCTAFAQAGSPAFSHSLQIPKLPPAKPLRGAAPSDVPAVASIPTPRSRGPPFQA